MQGLLAKARVVIFDSRDECRRFFASLPPYHNQYVITNASGNASARNSCCRCFNIPAAAGSPASSFNNRSSYFECTSQCSRSKQQWHSRTGERSVAARCEAHRPTVGKSGSYGRRSSCCRHASRVRSPCVASELLTRYAVFQG